MTGQRKAISDYYVQFLFIILKGQLAGEINSMTVRKPHSTHDNHTLLVRFSIDEIIIDTLSRRRLQTVFPSIVSREESFVVKFSLMKLVTFWP